MDFITPIVDTANWSVDQIFAVAFPIITVYVLYLVVRARKEILSGVPAWVRVFLANAIDRTLMPIVLNAVKAAEEHGSRLAKDGIRRAGAQVSDAKLAHAKQYVLDRVPNWLVPDAQLGQMIDAALVEIGKGATESIKYGVEKAKEGLGRIPSPPAA